MIARGQVMEGVAAMIHDVQVEATFPDGAKRVTVHYPIRRGATVKSTTACKLLLSLALLVALTPAGAMAHPGHPGHEALGLGAGFTHPLTGADHMLAMVAVGLWAALRGGRAIWAWPAAFVAAMPVGYAFGQAQALAGSIEPAVLASVIILGALTAARAKLPLAAGALLIGAFGAAHGYAHGAEAPHANLGFPLGFAATTAALHVAGLAAGALLKRFGRPELIGLLGAGVTAGGLILASA